MNGQITRETQIALPEARREALGIPPGLDGRLWHHVHRGTVIAPHLHDELEMNLAVRGTATYLVGERRYQLAPGVMIWLFPGQDHILVNQSADFAMWILVVKPSVVVRVAVAEGYETLTEDDPAGNFARVIGRKRLEQLVGVLGSVASQLADHVCFNTGVAYALTTSWQEFLNAGEIPETVGLHPAVERAVKALREDDDVVALDDLAAHAGLSLSRLSRLFHAQVGMPMVQFRNECRLDRFAAIRRSGNGRNLARAALDAGFGSYAQFYRVYVAAYGKGPR